MFLVTGGYDSDWEPIASTEVYRPSAGEWREVIGGALPRPMQEVRVVTLNNRVLLFGGLDNVRLFFGDGGEDTDRNEYADILEYSDEEGKWTRVGEMSEKRNFHAVSIIDFNKFKDYCQ